MIIDDIMELSYYQKQANKTAVYPKKHRVYYPALGLASEVGEVCGKIKKIMRGDKQLDAAYTKEIAMEISDCLWYVAQLATDLKLDLDKIAEWNLEKLKSRQQRGQLLGHGDKR